MRTAELRLCPAVPLVQQASRVGDGYNGFAVLIMGGPPMDTDGQAARATSRKVVPGGDGGGGGSVYNLRRARLVMFPIIPVLILLLLHGPSNVERLAHEGRLPSGLEAFHRKAEPATTVQRERAIIALLAARDPQFSTALFALLRTEEAPARPVRKVRPSEPQPVAFEDETPSPRDGFEECRRSRDGPLSIA